MAAAPTADGSPPVLPRRELTTPRSAAIAGILFAVLLGTSLVLLRLSVPARPQDAGLRLSDPTRRQSVRWALNLVPFAGIAFLWFIGVVRDPDRGLRRPLLLDRVPGQRAALPGITNRRHRSGRGLVASYATAAPGSDVWTFGRASTYAALNVYAVRMAGVFMISTATISWRTRVLARWLSVLGAVLAVGLLTVVTSDEPVLLLFPAWVLLVSTYLLLATRGARVTAQP
jgi:hypothetical protein